MESKVQVIMSTYNGEKYLKEQIESILKQVDCNVSILVRDDGSTDHTKQILHSYQDKGFLEVIEGDNLGVTKSFLCGVLNSSQDVDYYAFSDQDDVWMDEKLKRAVKLLSKIPDDCPALYCGNLCTVDENLNLIHSHILPLKVSTDIKDLIVHSSNIFGCTIVFNKSLRNLILSYIPQNAIMHDLWFGLIAALCGKIIYDPESFILYRQHGQNQVGAKEGFIQIWKSRIMRMQGKHKGAIAKQASDIMEFIKVNAIEVGDLYGYIKMVADYNKSLRNKFIYICKCSKKSMSKKQVIFHIILALLGKI